MGQSTASRYEYVCMYVCMSHSLHFELFSQLHYSSSKQQLILQVFHRYVLFTRNWSQSDVTGMTKCFLLTRILSFTFCSFCVAGEMKTSILLALMFAINTCEGNPGMLCFEHFIIHYSFPQYFSFFCGLEISSLSNVTHMMDFSLPHHKPRVEKSDSKQSSMASN